MSNEDPFPRQTRDVICNLYKYYDERKSILLCEQCDDVDVPKMVAEITGLSDVDIKKIVDEENKKRNGGRNGNGSHSRTRRSHSEFKVKIDKFTKVVIKREIAYYYQNEREFPSIMGLTKILEDKGVLKWKYEYMRRILEQLGFRLKKRSHAGCRGHSFK